MSYINLIESFGKIRLIAFDDIVKDYGTTDIIPKRLFSGGATSFDPLFNYLVNVMCEEPCYNKIFFISDGEDIVNNEIAPILLNFKQKLINKEFQINVIGIGDKINNKILTLISECGSVAGTIKTIYVDRPIDIEEEEE